MTLDDVHAQAARALDVILEVQYHKFEQSCIDSHLPLQDLADLSEWAHEYPLGGAVARSRTCARGW